jgi:hypothetical protein
MVRTGPHSTSREAATAEVRVDKSFPHEARACYSFVVLCELESLTNYKRSV